MWCCKHVKLDSGWWVIKAADWSGANINSSRRSSWTPRREEWQHDAEHSVPQPHEGDGARAVSDGASGGFLCTAPGLRVPSAERPGEKPGAHRWLALLQGKNSFRELARKVRGQKTLERSFVHLHMYLYVQANSRGAVWLFDDRKVKMHNLWEYTSTRKSLLSKRIYLLMSACQENFSDSNKKAAGETKGNLNHLFMK